MKARPIVRRSRALRGPESARHPSATSPWDRRRLRQRSFDECASLYERARPGYPERLFDDLVRLSGIPPGGRILEVGPGPGTATLPLARRGFRILAIELSRAMARRCRKNLAPFPRTTVLNQAFEDWPVETGAFDLVVAATALHWLHPRLAFCRTANALRPGGSLAILRNFRDTPADPLHRELDRAYREVGLPARVPAPERRFRRRITALRRSGRFGRILTRRYPWTRVYTPGEYIDLLCTMSDHAVMPTSTRRRLFRRIRSILTEHGGRYARRYIGLLVLARKRPPAR